MLMEATLNFSLAVYGDLGIFRERLDGLTYNGSRPGAASPLWGDETASLHNKKDLT
jgi:hypothetical protein